MLVSATGLWDAFKGNRNADESRPRHNAIW
jgi:hypothetical protein